MIKSWFNDENMNTFIIMQRLCKHVIRRFCSSSNRFKEQTTNASSNSNSGKKTTKFLKNFEFSFEEKLKIENISARKIHQLLCEGVVGQDKAKKVIIIIKLN